MTIKLRQFIAGFVCAPVSGGSHDGDDCFLGGIIGSEILKMKSLPMALEAIFR